MTGVPLGFNSAGQAVDSVQNSNSVSSTSSSSASGSVVVGGAAGQSFSYTKTRTVTRAQLTLGKNQPAVVLGSGRVPGAVLRYTLPVQASQNHTYSNVIIRDTVSDGQLFDGSRAPQLLLFRTADATTGAALPAPVLLSQSSVLPAAFTVDTSRISVPPDGRSTDATDGSTLLTFNVSRALLDANPSSNGRFAGPLLFQLQYFTILQTTYSDTSVDNGDRNVYGGDCIDNIARLDTTQVLYNATGTVLGQPSRTAGVTPGIANAEVISSSVYAVGGQRCSNTPQPARCAAPVEVDTGTDVTLRVRMQMPQNAFRQLRVAQALPIPLFDIASLRWPIELSGPRRVDISEGGNACSGTALPARDRMCVLNPPHSLVRNDPAFSVTTSDMSWQLDFGSAPFTTSSNVAFDVLLTTRLTDTPWIDGFDAVTLESKRENPGAGCVSSPLSFLQLRTRTPQICSFMGIVGRRAVGASSFDALDARFAAATGQPTSVVSEASVLATAIGASSLANIAAGDRLRVVVAIINEGRGAAHDIELVLPNGAAASTFYSVASGTAVLLGDRSGTPSGGAIAGGVATVPTLAGAAARDGSDASGTNVLLVTFEVTVLDAFPSGNVLASALLDQLRGTLRRYTGLPGSARNFVTLHAAGEYPPECTSHSLALAGSVPTFANDLVSGDVCTSDGNIAVGEEFRIGFDVRLPFGTLRDASLQLATTPTTLPYTLLNWTLTSMPAVAANGQTAGAALVAGPVVGSGSNAFGTQTATFGALTLRASSFPTQTMRAEAWLVGRNPTALAEGASSQFTHTFTYREPTTDALLSNVQTTAIVARRQALTISGSTNSTVADPADEGDFIRFCFRLTRQISTACAYNVSLTIPIKTSAFTLRPNSATAVFVSGAPAIAGASVTQTAGQVTFTVPQLAANSAAIDVCYVAEYVSATVGVIDPTTGTVCTDTTPASTTDATTCNANTINVTPLPVSLLTVTSDDTCTSDSQSDVRVGEILTLTVSATVPKGRSPSFSLAALWSASARLTYIDSELVSYTGCTNTPLAVGNVGTVAAGSVTWSFGDIVRSQSSDPSCGVITVRVRARATSAAVNTAITLTGRATTSATTDSKTRTYRIRSPAIAFTGPTLVPATGGDAGDTTQLCTTATNNAGARACAYDTIVTPVLPTGFVLGTGAVPSYTVPLLAPGQSSAQLCWPVRLADSVTTSECRTAGVSADYASGADRTVALVQTATGTTAQYCTAVPLVSGSIFATDDTCTSGNNVQQSERITYRAVVTLPEGVSPLVTVRFQFPSGLTYESGSARVVSIGSSLAPTIPNPSATVSGAQVSMAFGSTTNAPVTNAVLAADDQLVVEMRARVSQTVAFGTSLAPEVRVLHATAIDVVAPSAPLTTVVVRPQLTVTGSVTPAQGAAQTETARFSFLVVHASAPTSSQCAYQLSLCFVPPELNYNIGSILLDGAPVSSRPGATIVSESVTGGVCIFVPNVISSDPDIVISFDTTFRDLPGGDTPRCVSSTVNYFSGPVPNEGGAMLTATGSVCVPQRTLEALGDFVWRDTNGNGRQDTGEPGIAGVAVRLVRASDGVVISTRTTDANGRYVFTRVHDGLVPGTLYDLVIDAQPGLQATLRDATSDSLDSDAQEDSFRGPLRISGASVAPVSENFSFDFGLAEPIRIGDYVWFDANSNGLQDTGETPLAGVIVTLRHAGNSSVIATTATSASGLYSFSSLNIAVLRPGAALTLSIDNIDTQPPLRTTVGGRSTFRVPSLANVGANRAVDSNAALSGTSATFSYTVPSRWNVDDQTLDFGFVEPQPLGFSFGDFVFLDVNNDGVQQPGVDVPLAGVTVRLASASAPTVVIASTVTNATGQYQFNSVGAGYARLESLVDMRVFIPASDAALVGRQATIALASAATPATDSNAVRETSTGNLVVTFRTPVDGTVDFTLDFGVRQVTLGGDVFADANANGAQDAGDTPVGAGRIVTLYDSTGTTVLATTIVQPDGTYSFNSHVTPALTPGGDYVIGLSLPPAYQPTLPNAIGDDALDSDGVLRPGSTTEVLTGVVRAPSAGGTDLTNDFGLVLRYFLGDFVWRDSNGNGIQDAGEPGLANVRVQLLDTTLDNAVVSSTRTAANGLYQFSSLQPGQTLPQLTAGRYVIEVSVDTTVSSNLLHLLPTESGLGSSTTGSDGVFDQSRNAVRSAVTTPAFGVTDNQYDFGFRSLEIGNRVWRDVDADGVQDAGEPGLVGVVVELRDSLGALLATTTTGADGVYVFRATDGVAAGADYEVRVLLAQPVLAGLLPTHAEAAAGNEASDSDATVTTATYVAVPLVAPAWGSSNFDIADFGFQPLLEIGDFVWRDSNGNGRQDAGESGIEGVAVQLSDGVTTLETTTNAAGNYLFSRLEYASLNPSAAYSLFVALNQLPLAGLQPTLTLAAGVADSADSNGVWRRDSALSIDASVQSPPFGARDLTFDFGFAEPLAVGGLLWLDADGDGVRDAGEPLLANVLVQLYDVLSGALIGSVQSDANGVYVFRSNETSGTLGANALLEVRVPLGTPALAGENGALLPTLANRGGDDTRDSDAIYDQVNALATITGVRSGAFGSDTRSFDYGFVGPLVIGDFVWLDSNANGAQVRSVLQR